MVQMIEYLPSKCETQSSKSILPKKITLKIRILFMNKEGHNNNYPSYHNPTFSFFHKILLGVYFYFLIPASGVHILNIWLTII
jgi:hypothetical protein